MDGHVRGRERYIFSICLALSAIPELILAIVIAFLFPFDRAAALKESSYITLQF